MEHPILTQKQTKEHARRGDIVRKIEELKNLIQTDDFPVKPSQEKILMKSLEVAIRFQRSSFYDPYLRGLSKEYEKILDLAVSHIKSLNIDELVKLDHIKTVNEHFEMFHAILFNTNQLLSSIPLLSSIDTRKESNSEKRDCKKIKADREQLRRDHLAVAYNGLLKFVLDNNLADKRNKLQRSEVLRIMITYISEKILSESRVLNAEDKIQFDKGVIDGQIMCKTFAFQLFKTVPSLFPHTASLQLFLEFNVNPMSLLRFPNMTLINFPLSSTGSIESSSPSTPSSIEDEQKNESPMKEPISFRPYL